MKQCDYEIKYIELKSGYSDNGPAWIGKVKLSKSGSTFYFNDKAFKKSQGISGNYYDIETYEEYWISGVKKNGEDRHPAGNGKVMIDSKIVSEYLSIIGENKINSNYLEVVDIKDIYPIERIAALENNK